MTGAERRKATKIARIMEEFNISDYDEAEEKYRESFRLLGSIGGRKTGETKRRGDSKHYSAIGKLGGAKKKR